MFLLKTMFEQSHPHHGYVFEPQSHQYLLHGDLWDCAYDRARAPNIFLPMTLELGSWLLDQEESAQLFSRHGIYNPMKAHRTRRVLRRHRIFSTSSRAPRFRRIDGCRAANSVSRSCSRQPSTGGARARDEPVDPAAWPDP